MVITLILTLAVLFLLNVPIAVALGLGTFLVVSLSGSFEVATLPNRMFNALDSFPLLAAPFFILAGKIMEHGGISEKLVKFANSLVGHMKGGLAHVSIVACMFFAALSGSSVATTAAVGGLLIPAMVKAGYDRNFATAVQAAGGTTGIIIPPSVPMVLFAVTGGVSVGDLFLGGIIPGLLVGVSLMLVAYVYSSIKGYKTTAKSNGSEVGQSLIDSLLALLMPVIILGGIYGGIFTPTEASVIAVVYGLVVGKFIYKKITFSVLKEILLSTVITVSVLSLIIASASFFGLWLTLERIPHTLGEYINGTSLSPFMIMTLVIIILLIIGTFMEPMSAIIILTPILLPVTTTLGIDPVHFGIVMIVTLSIGLITPPVGLNLFVAAKVGEIRYESLIKPTLPFIFILIVDVIIILLVPQLSVGIANLLK
ncbi:TRAP transporter large permease [Alkalihalobacillus deserti]|uniref:TRAP transporter large permease n=1 Tax=Alkalihalobacillus deserti TaxID=2879466 RepID=UPI001D134930|nr:TRAP transporter large permease [Alkalihalobacillus deserti]